MNARRVGLDVDLGELPDEPEALYAAATIANVACGGHAGDRASMERAVGLALRHGARVAAHPSYPDREGFGRRSLGLAPREVRAAVAAQCAALRAVAEAAGARVEALKAHGALYHDAARDPALAAALLDGAREALGDVVVLGPPTGALAASPRYLREGFADRGYRPDGSLTPRGEPGALLDDPGACADQAVALARSGAFDVLCVHGDGPRAVEVAATVRAALARHDLLELPGAPARDA